MPRPSKKSWGSQVSESFKAKERRRKLWERRKIVSFWEIWDSKVFIKVGAIEKVKRKLRTLKREFQKDTKRNRKGKTQL